MATTGRAVWHVGVGELLVALWASWDIHAPIHGHLSAILFDTRRQLLSVLWKIWDTYTYPRPSACRLRDALLLLHTPSPIVFVHRPLACARPLH
jgi:hypothetical protein